VRGALPDDAPLACVIGEIDLVRALALAGVASAVVAQPGNPARYSRSAVAKPEWIDPWQHPDSLADHLVAFASSQPSKPVLFYDGDWDLLFVSRHRERLATAFRFVVADRELVEDLVDKERFQRLAERLELPVPRAARLSAIGAGTDPGLRFPLIAKPLTRQHETWRSITDAKAVHLQTPADLQRLRGQLIDDDPDLLLQEQIPGPETRIESYHVYMDEDGTCAGEFTGRKLRTHPPGYGYSTALMITDSDDVRATGRELTDRIGLRGVAKLDFKRDEEGRLSLLEVNPRFNLWHHPGAIAGVNLPALVYHDLAGFSRPPAVQTRAGVRWCSLAHDLQAARADGMTTLQWLRWAATCEAKSGFALRDPLPLPAAALWRLRRRARSRQG
jgi:predicted ATP-grasp superfamily ATP-dependent carboligase